MANRREHELGADTKCIDDFPRSEIEHIIDEWIRSERDRAVLKRRLLDGITYERLAEEFDLSARRIKSIVYKGMDRIANHLPRV